MGTNKIKKRAGLFAQLLFSLSLFSFSCTDDETLYLSKEFSLPVEVTPVKEAYKVGDTLKISILIPKLMSDRENTVQYLFEDFDFDPLLSIRELKNRTKDIADQPGANNKVRVINEIGEIVPFSAAGSELLINYDGSRYRLTSKLILLNKGVFNFMFTGEITGTAELINPPAGYKNIIAGVAPSFFLVNSGIPFNYHLFPKYTASEFDTSEGSDTRGRSFFPFVVEE
jgi:hypothetical protein